jgi:hypothetical protein
VPDAEQLLLEAQGPVHRSMYFRIFETVRAPVT